MACAASWDVSLILLSTFLHFLPPGFLPALDGGASRGNFGLMDQVAALHWIQENIAEFGGDASNVTIAGHGHGAACVNLLMISPMVRGLFHRAIIQSGSALSPWTIASNGVKYAREVSSFLGCPAEAKKYHQMVDCLRRKSVDDLLSAEPVSPSYLSTFGPTIDSATIKSDPFNAMLSSETLFAEYDLMFGVTHIESFDHFNAEDERDGIDPVRRDRILRTLIRNLYSYRLQEIFLTISNEYTDWTRSSFNHPLSVLESTAEAIGDATIVAPTVRAGLLHARRVKESKSPRKTYFYNFAYSDETVSSSTSEGKISSLHGEELPFLFGAPLLSPHFTPSSSFPYLGFFDTKRYSIADASLSEVVMSYWINFVKTG